MKRRIIYIALGIFLLGALYGLREYFRGHKDLTSEPPVAQLTAKVLIEAFEEDSLRSSRLYENKVVAVQGRITNLQAEDNPVIITLGEEGQMSSVQCSIESTHVAAYRNLITGEMVTIKGICTGAISQDLFGTVIKLSRCNIEKK